MIPSIFVSSTSAANHDLRDGIRDAIEELSYQPVMSDYGESGHAKSTITAESCYQSIQQCQMMVPILGRHYGEIDRDGLSNVERRRFRMTEDHCPIDRMRDLGSNQRSRATA